MQDKARYSECEKLLLEGRYKEAFLLASDINDPAYRAAILIDAGYQLNRPNALREGIRLFEETLNEDVSQTIDFMRNRITHDYLTILSEYNVPTNSKAAISHSEMKDKTLSMLLLAKYTALYVVSAINIAEFQKRSGDSVPTIYYHNIPGLTSVD